MKETQKKFKNALAGFATRGGASAHASVLAVGQFDARDTTAATASNYHIEQNGYTGNLPNAQVTVGGANYYVIGQQGNYIVAAMVVMYLSPDPHVVGDSKNPPIPHFPYNWGASFTCTNSITTFFLCEADGHNPPGYTVLATSPVTSSATVSESLPSETSPNLTIALVPAAPNTPQSGIDNGITFSITTSAIAGASVQFNLSVTGTINNTKINISNYISFSYPIAVIPN